MNDELKIIIPLEIDKRKSDDNIKAYLKTMQNNIELKLTIEDSSQQQARLIKQANNVIDNIAWNLKPIKPQFDFEQFNLSLDLSNNNLKEFKDSFEDLKKAFKDSSNKPDFGIFKDLFSQELFDNIKNPVEKIKDLIADLKNLQITEINPPLKDAQTIIDIYNEHIGEVNLAQKIFDNIPEANDEGFSKYLKTLNGGKASFDGYNESIGNTSQALASLTLKTLGFKAVQAAANAAIGMGVGLLINFAVSGITKLIQAHQEAIETSNEITSKFKDSQSEIRNNISALSDLESEYNKLSRGVDTNGKNIGLSAEEYKRYKKIVQQIADISPSLVVGYDDEGNAIINRNDAVREAINLQKELNDLNAAEYLTQGEDILKGSRNEIQDIESERNEIYNSLNELVSDNIFAGFKKSNVLADVLGFDKFDLSNSDVWHFLRQNQQAIIDNIDKIIAEGKKQGILSDEEIVKIREQISLIQLKNKEIDNSTSKITNYLRAYISSDTESNWYNKIQTQYLDEFNEALENISSDGTLNIDQMKVAATKLGEEFVNIQEKLPTAQINELNKEFKNGEIDSDEYNTKLETHIDTLNKMADEQQALGKTDVASIIRSIADEWHDLSSRVTSNPVIRNIQEQSTESWEELAKTYGDATNKISSYHAILRELNSTEGLSAKSKQDIIINHQKLLPFLSNEQELRKQLIKLIGSEEDTQTTAYLQMLMTSEEFFNTKIKGNKETFDKLQEFYGVDLTRTKDLAEAKLKVESSLLGELTGKWGDYYNAQSDTLNYNYTELRKLEANPGGDPEAGKRAGKLADEILDTYIKYNNIADAFKNITLENIDLPEINLNTDISDKTVENKKIFETLYANLRNQREMDEIDTQKYYDDLKKLHKNYLADNSDYIEDERRIALELRKLQQDIVSERISDIEHEILKLEQEDNTEQQRIRLYKNIQDELHKQAEYSRSLELSGNEDYIQELQKQWLSYAQKIIDTQNGIYENSKKTIEEKNTLLDIEQKKVRENSKEYLEIEYQKYSLVLEQQEVLKNEIQRLEKESLTGSKKRVKELQDAWYSYEIERLDKLNNLKNKQIDYLKEQKDSITSLQEYVVNMIKKQYEEEKKYHEKKIENIQKEFELRKNALDKEHDDKDYNKSKTEQMKNINSLQEQYDLLLKTNDKVKQAKVYEDLMKAKQDYDDFLYEHGIETQKNMLDEEMENQIKKHENEIEEIENHLNNKVELQKKANKLIEGDQDSLYKQLIQYSNTYGEITRQEIDEVWKKATGSLQEFNKGQINVLNTLDDIVRKMEELDKASIIDFESQYSKNKTGSREKAIIEVMKQNSAMWLTANAADRKKLEKENQELGSQIGAFYDSTTGQWFTDSSKSKLLYNSYHTGGFAGNKPLLESNEIFAKLLKGEGVFTPIQMDNFIKNTLPNIAHQITNANNRIGDLKFETVYQINGAFSEQNKLELERMHNQNQNKVIEGFVKVLKKNGFNKNMK